MATGNPLLVFWLVAGRADLFIKINPVNLVMPLLLGRVENTNTFG